MNKQHSASILNNFVLEHIKHFASTFSTHVSLNEIDSDYRQSRFFEMALDKERTIIIVLEISVAPIKNTEDKMNIFLNLFATKDRAWVKEYDVLYMSPYLPALTALQLYLDNTMRKIVGQLLDEQVPLSLTNQVREKLTELKKVTPEDKVVATQFVENFENNYKPFFLESANKVLQERKRVQKENEVIQEDVSEVILSSQRAFLNSRIDHALAVNDENTFKLLANELALLN